MNPNKDSRDLNEILEDGVKSLTEIELALGAIVEQLNHMNTQGMFVKIDEDISEN